MLRADERLVSAETTLQIPCWCRRMRCGPGSRESSAGAGVPADQAEVVAGLLVEADLRGVDSHGAHLMSMYATRLASGDIKASTTVTTTSDEGSTVHLDGGLGFGQIAGLEAARLVAERAAAHGVAVVAVRESTHLGALGAYTSRVAEAGIICLCVQNGPTFVPPFGGITALFSTNPLSYAIPTDCRAGDRLRHRHDGSRRQQGVAREEARRQDHPRRLGERRPGPADHRYGGCIGPPPAVVRRPQRLRSCAARGTAGRGARGQFLRHDRAHRLSAAWRRPCRKRLCFHRDRPVAFHADRRLPGERRHPHPRDPQR